MTKFPSWFTKFGDYMVVKMAECFQMKVVCENVEALSKTGPAIVALEPHHVLPVAMLSFNAKLKGIPGHNCYGTTTPSVLKIPILRHVYSLAEARSADKTSLLKLLNERKSPVITPGGVEEAAYITSKDECILYLEKKKGFVKLALEQGVAIIPAFTFNAHRAYKAWIPKGHWIRLLGKKLGFQPMLIFGCWGLPFGPPSPCSVTTVVGDPIDVPKVDNPSEEELNKYHRVYISRIQSIFENHKSTYGMENFQLKII
jgi:2-acylglycerol O-acyltransferase 2